MSGINFGRWLLGGIAAGALLWIVEGLASLIYFAEMQAAMDAHGLAMEMGAGTYATTIAVSLISGLTLIFFYAAARPRFGPGPKTAVIVAAAYWIGGYVLSLLGYQMIGLFPAGMLAVWGVLGLVELVLAAILGAWIYREGEPGGPAPMEAAA